MENFIEGHVQPELEKMLPLEFVNAGEPYRHLADLSGSYQSEGRLMQALCRRIVGFLSRSRV
jgi:hypothetical protein